MDVNYTEQKVLCINYNQAILYMLKIMSYMSQTSANHAIIMHS